MYNKKEWVNDEIITKEALNNIENGIADLDDKINDVATKKELEAVENNIAENTIELNDLKEGLVASLVAQGHKVDMNSSWKDLFDILLVGSDSVPDVPNPDDPEDGDGIVLLKDGILGDTNTPFRNLCEYLKFDGGCGYQEGSGIVWNFNSGNDRGYAWFSFDGYVDFNDYKKVKIKCFTEHSTQQPSIQIYGTTQSGQTGHSSSSSGADVRNHYVFDTETVMTNVTPTYYELDIDASKLSNGYLLITMDQGYNDRGGAWGRFFITDIIVYPKETENDDPIEIVDDEITIQVGGKYDATKLYTLQDGYNVQYKYSAIIAIEGEHTIVGKEVGTTELEIICGKIIKTVTVNVVESTGGMVLFDNGEHYRTEFGGLIYPTNYVSHVSDIDFNLSTTYCTYAAICFDGYINFNNYDAIAITVHTENTQQTDTQLMVGRGLDPTHIVGAGTPPYTVSYEESTFSTMTNTKTQATYIFSFDALRQENDDMGYLGIRVLRGNADGHVYIDKIVVYRDGEYNSGV